MNDELLILTGLDQPIEANNDWILQKAEEIIQKALREHDAEIALSACEQLVRASKLSGLGLAKLLYLINTHWIELGETEPFEDVAYLRLGLHRHTVERYVSVWNMFASGTVPEQVTDLLKQQNIKSLIPIATAINQGYEIPKETWDNLAHAPDFATVSQIVREDIKGKDPRASSLQLHMDNIGTLWAIAKGNRFFVGSLDIESDVPVVMQSIERILKNAGILRM